MYNNYVLFLVGLFIFTILIQYVDRQFEKREEFRRRRRRRRRGGFKKAFKKAGKDFKKAGGKIKKFAQSPAGIATFSIMAGAACGVATMGNPVVAAACAGAVGGGIGGSILEDNKRRKKRYRQRRAEEHKRRCRVLSGDENPSHTNNPIFNGYESLSSPCKEFRKKNCTETSSGTCNTLKTQCRLARSCIFYDKHLS